MRASVAITLLAVAGFALAADPAFRVTWDKVTDARLVKYEVAYGASSGAYTTTISVDKALNTADILKTGWPVYYVAARACATGQFCSDWSNEISVPIMPAPTNLKAVLTWTIP